MDKNKVILFNKGGTITDPETIEAEQKIFDALAPLILSYRRRKIPLVEVRAVIQCLIGTVNEGMVTYFYNASNNKKRVNRPLA